MICPPAETTLRRLARCVTIRLGPKKLRVPHFCVSRGWYQAPIAEHSGAEGGGIATGSPVGVGRVRCARPDARRLPRPPVRVRLVDTAPHDTRARVGPRCYLRPAMPGEIVTRLLQVVDALRVVQSGRIGRMHPDLVLQLRFVARGPTPSSPADVLELERRRTRLAALLADTGITADEAIAAALVDRDVARLLVRAGGRVTPKCDRPRCGARTRSGTPCQARAVWDDEHDRPRTPRGRCRMHGGLSTGPRTAEGHAAATGAGLRNLARINAERARRRSAPSAHS